MFIPKRANGAKDTEQKSGVILYPDFLYAPRTRIRFAKFRERATALPIRDAVLGAGLRDRSS